MRRSLRTTRREGLFAPFAFGVAARAPAPAPAAFGARAIERHRGECRDDDEDRHHHRLTAQQRRDARDQRSEEHTSELQSLMRTSYAVFCLKKTQRLK